MNTLPIEAAFPWTLEILEAGELIDSELHRTHEAAQEAMDSLAEDGLSGRIVSTKSPSLLPFLRSIGS